MVPRSGATLASHRGAAWQLYLAGFGIPGWLAAGFGPSRLVKQRKDGGLAKLWSQQLRINGKPHPSLNASWDAVGVTGTLR